MCALVTGVQTCALPIYQNSDGALIATGQSGFQGLKLHIRRAARQSAADIVKTDHVARHRPRSDDMLAMRMSGSRGGRRPGTFTPRCDCALAEADQFPALALPCIDGYREIGSNTHPIAIADKQLTVRPGET